MTRCKQIVILIAVQLLVCEFDSKAINYDEIRTETENSESVLPFTDTSVNRNVSQPLPKIDSIVYLKLNTGFDFNFNNAQELNHLKSFNNQLPDVNKFEVYYSEFNCYTTKDPHLTNICSNFADLVCGFLIFYETATQIAHIVNIKNSYYMDSSIDMNFVIDKNYQIHLTETETTDGDEEPDGTINSESHHSNKHLIEIKEDGLIKIGE